MLVRDPATGRYWLYCKGADAAVIPLLHSNNDSEVMRSLTEGVKVKTKAVELLLFWCEDLQISNISINFSFLFVGFFLFSFLQLLFCCCCLLFVCFFQFISNSNNFCSLTFLSIFCLISLSPFPKRG